MQRRPHRIHPALLGFRPRRERRRGPKREPTPDELLQRLVSRAWQCGARHTGNGWRRRPPPRMGAYRSGAPDADSKRAQCQAFFRGFDAALRAASVRRQAWRAPWDDGGDHRGAAA